MCCNIHENRSPDDVPEATPEPVALLGLALRSTIEKQECAEDRAHTQQEEPGVDRVP